jgi:hypothetical protein
MLLTLCPPAGSYNFTLTIAKDSRRASTQVFVRVGNSSLLPKVFVDTTRLVTNKASGSLRFLNEISIP